MIPKFTSLGDARLNEKGDLVLAFVGEDRKVYTFELTPGVVPMLIVQLLALSDQRNAKFPQDNYPLQPIVMTTATGGVDQVGRVALMMGTENGLRFPLQIELADLKELAGLFEDLIALHVNQTKN